jgi:predicted amidohydrolase YtcJ
LNERCDTLFANGNILTMDETMPIASAILVRNGRVVRTGGSEALRSDIPAGTEIVDLAGRTMVPGFSDAHAHIWKIGHLLTSMVDLRTTGSLTELKTSVSQRDNALPPDAWLLGRGFNEVAMVEKRKPTRHDLDLVVSDRPVVLTRTCGHIYAVNSVALKLAGINANTPDPTGGVIERDERGEPNGLLHETAMGLINRVLPPPTSADYREMISAALRHQLSLGITASSDCGVIPELLSVYMEMEHRGELPARMNVMPLRRVDGRPDPVPHPEQYISDTLRVDTVKFLADGGLSGATAALSIPYRHADTKGTLRFEFEDLKLLCQESHDAGWRIATHAIGDIAIDQVLSIYEGLGEHSKGWRHRIEHFGLPSGEQLERAARLGVISVPQTIFLYSLGENFAAMVPDAFLPRTYPIRAMFDAGLTVALSSDAPVVQDDNPFMGMYAAITRRTRQGRVLHPEQSITIDEALLGYTVNGALASGEEVSRGSLSPGKWADLAILSDDPRMVEIEELKNIRVESTFLAGKKVFEA